MSSDEPMDDDPTHQASSPDADAPIGHSSAISSVQPEPFSPFEPRAAARSADIPAAQDRSHLRQAAAAVVQQGLTISEAAARYGVDPDSLHIWHRSYVNFVGKNSMAASPAPVREKVGIDEQSIRKFDENWDEMLRQWELERPQPSALRKRLLSSPLTNWMFRDGKLDKITVSGAVAAVAFSALAIKAGISYQGDRPQVDPNDQVGTQSGPLDPDAQLSDHQDELLERVARALEEFTTLETWQERLRHIRNPEAMKPLMASYYATHSDGPISGLVIDAQVSFIKRTEGIFVLLQGYHAPAGADLSKTEPIIFLAEISDQDPGVLFDWEVLVNYEPVSWQEFVADKNTTPSPFRVRVSFGDYYNQPFMDAVKFASFAIRLLHRDELVYGFVERGSKLAKQLEEHVAKELAGNRAMILNLRFPDEAKFDNVLEIESIAADGWLEE